MLQDKFHLCICYPLYSVYGFIIDFKSQSIPEINYMGEHYIANPSGHAVLRRGSAATHLLGLWVPIPLGAWMSVCLLQVLCVVR